jgi:L-malate glycosyltransferase
LNKKVLIIQQIIPEYRKDFFNLLKSELTKNGVDLMLVYGNRSSSYKSGIHYSTLEWGKLVPNKTIKLGKVEICWQPVFKYLKNKDLVIVEQANRLIFNYLLIAIRKLLGIKLGFWGHGRNMKKVEGSLSNTLTLKYLRSCDWWFSYTKSVKFYLISNKYPSNKITIVQNAIDTDNLRKALEDINDNEMNELKSQLEIHGDNTAIFCGGMYPEKRIAFILNCCHIIKKEIPDFHMIFIGAGVEENKVKEAAQSYKWIHYVGTKEGQERVKYFKIANLQLMPGAVGLAILDSFALETPIITTCDKSHGPEIDYLENGKNGMMTNNVLEEYTRTTIDLFENKKYLDLIPGCKYSANKFSVENMVNNFKNGILECLSQSK